MPSLYAVDPSLSPVDHRYLDDATVSSLLTQRVAGRMQLLVFVQGLSAQQHPLQHLVTWSRPSILAGVLINRDAAFQWHSLHVKLPMKDS